MKTEKHQQFILTKPLVLLMAVICGATVANLYYIQPLEAQVASTFHISQSAVGVAAMLTQIGYALGLLLIVPLGDMVERRSVILRMLLLIAASLLLAGLAPTYAVLLIAMFAIGITTIVPQLVIPYAAQLSKPKEQGKTIGNVMSGLLIGILLSRTFSGLVGSAVLTGDDRGQAAVLNLADRLADRSVDGLDMGAGNAGGHIGQGGRVQIAGGTGGRIIHGLGIQRPLLLDLGQGAFCALHLCLL